MVLKNPLKFYREVISKLKTYDSLVNQNDKLKDKVLSLSNKYNSSEKAYDEITGENFKLGQELKELKENSELNKRFQDYILSIPSQMDYMNQARYLRLGQRFLDKNQHEKFSLDKYLLEILELYSNHRFKGWSMDLSFNYNPLEIQGDKYAFNEILTGTIEALKFGSSSLEVFLNPVPETKLKLGIQRTSDKNDIPEDKDFEGVIRVLELYGGDLRKGDFKILNRGYNKLIDLKNDSSGQNPRNIFSWEFSLPWEEFVK